MNYDQDVDHLRLLSIFHYVLAGILAVCSLLPVLHVALGIAMVSGAFDEFAHGNPPPEIFGWLFIIFPSFLIICGLTFSVCTAIAGRRLGRHCNYTYCLVVAGIECVFMPLGTVLGVFTIMVLMRPTVKTLFGIAENS